MFLCRYFGLLCANAWPETIAYEVEFLNPFFFLRAIIEMYCTEWQDNAETVFEDWYKIYNAVVDLDVT